ncbi:MAG: glycosyltransferase family 61 protein [Lachnospiraceae bacterium]|nr:glycosyltransferase family 61 protein [Lachnospiraceae bacterium]
MKADRRYLRPEKAKLHETLYAGFEKRGKPEVHTLKDAEILPLIRFEKDGDSLMFGRGACMDKDGNYFAPSGMEARIGGFYEHEKGPFEDKRVVFCGYFARGWGHFLMESICRLWYLTENDPSVDEWVFVTGENGPTDIIKGNFLRFFKLLGIENKVRILNRPAVFREVIVPELSYSRAHYYTDEYTSLLNMVCESALKDASFENLPDKVYLSRRHVYDKKHFYGGTRYREYGLDLMDDYFERNGFRIVFPERTPLPELIALLRNANTVASESGSCAHNLVFLSPGSSDIIMERHAFGNDHQAEIDVILDLNTTYVDACYGLYPMDAFGGPYILMYTDCMKRFSEENGYMPPSERFLSDQNKKKAINWYLWLYHHINGRKIFMTPEILPWGAAFMEMADETAEVFDKWLNPPLSRLMFKLHEKLGYRRALL